MSQRVARWWPRASSVLAELGVVEELAVEGDPDGAVLVGDRLPAAGEVDDREPPGPQGEPGLAVDGARRRARGGRWRRSWRRSRSGGELARTGQVQGSGNPAHRGRFSSLSADPPGRHVPARPIRSQSLSIAKATRSRIRRPTRGECGQGGRDLGPAAARPPVDQAAGDDEDQRAEPHQEAARAERDIERHDWRPFGGCTVTWESTICSSAPAWTGGAWRPSQTLLPPAKRSAIGRPRPGMIVSGRAALVGEDHRDAEVTRDPAGDRPREGADLAEQPVLAAGLAVGEVRPGGRHDRQVDPASITVPDSAIDHVGADREADPPPGGRDHQGVAARPGTGTAPRRRGSASGRRAPRRRAGRRPTEL